MKFLLSKYKNKSTNFIIVNLFSCLIIIIIFLSFFFYTITHTIKTVKEQIHLQNLAKTQEVAGILNDKIISYFKLFETFTKTESIPSLLQQIQTNNLAANHKNTVRNQLNQYLADQFSEYHKSSFFTEVILADHQGKVIAFLGPLETKNISQLQDWQTARKQPFFHGSPKNHPLTKQLHLPVFIKIKNSDLIGFLYIKINLNRVIEETIRKSISDKEVKFILLNIKNLHFYPYEEELFQTQENIQKITSHMQNNKSWFIFNKATFISFDSVLQNSRMSNSSFYLLMKQNLDSLYSPIRGLKTTLFSTVFLFCSLLLFILISNIFQIRFFVQDKIKTLSRFSEKEKRFNTSFSQSPLALIEFNYHTIKEYLQDLKKRGFENIFQYLETHPTELQEKIKKIKIIDLNNQTLALFESNNKQEVIDYLEKSLSTIYMELIKKILSSIGNKPRTFQQEIQIITLKNKKIPVFLDLKIVSDKSDKKEELSRLIITLYNISQLKKFEQKFKDNHDFFNSIFNRTDQALLVIKIIDGIDFQVAAMNDAAEKKTGVLFNDIQELNLSQLAPKYLMHKKIDPMLSRYNKCLKLQRTILYKERTKYNGQVNWWYCRITPLVDEQGKVYRIIDSSININTLKKAELKLKKYTKKLKLSNEELDDFVYIASHDLKEPLRGIANYAALLEENYSHIMDPNGKKKLNTLIYLSQRMNGFINDLLEYSRLNRQNLIFQLEDINLILDEVWTILRASHMLTNVKLIIPKKLPQIYCDRIKLTQVFQNLLSNAIKYNDKEEIKIKVGFYLIRKKKKQFLFYIKDNGIGITENQQIQIFKIFKRLHKRDEYGGGTGAGLTIVKKIIERHNGKIWVESKLGKGTTFFFTIGEKPL
ncbi:MAG: ATP-binding protein [Spirochaetes bacterium]|nr:ATP-binding protein [Spirochaetota bacterium]